MLIKKYNWFPNVRLHHVELIISLCIVSTLVGYRKVTSFVVHAFGAGAPGHCLFLLLWPI